MAYDAALAEQVRHVLVGAGAPVREQQMFGGVAFMVRGHMTAGVLNEDLLVRVGREAYEEAVGLPAARPMDFTGKVMKSMVLVAAADLDDPALEQWVLRGLEYTSTLPAK